MSTPETAGEKPIRITLCDDGHRAMKQHEATWNSSRFGGYRPLGAQLGEVRYCHVCQQAVVRLVPFATALLEVLTHLGSPEQPSETYLRSASVLTSWARANLPPGLGIDDGPVAPAPPPAGSIADWSRLGLQIREARERAGLSRRKLSRISGLADSTIRNLETGRHQPTAFTLHRLSRVPELTHTLHPDDAPREAHPDATPQDP